LGDLTISNKPFNLRVEGLESFLASLSCQCA